MKRLDIKAILRDPAQRRALMIETIIATQAREGIATTRAQAEAAYDVVRSRNGCRHSSPRQRGFSMKILIVLIYALAFAACNNATQTAPDAATINVDGVIVDAELYPRTLVALLGQSNSAGVGRVTELTGDLAYLAEPYDAVPFTAHVGNDADPPVFVEMPLGPLQPYTSASGIASFGTELSLGRALDAAHPGRFALAKFAHGSTSLVYEWNPDGMYPRNDASPDNLFTQAGNFVEAVYVATQATTIIVVWAQGEADAAAQQPASAYGTNLENFIARLRARFPNVRVRFVIVRLHINVPAMFTNLVRAGEEHVATTVPDVALVDADPFEQRTDLVHFTGRGYVGLGAAIADVIVN